MLSTQAELCKRAELSVGAESWGPKELCIRWGLNFPRKGTILGGYLAHQKHWESLLLCMQQKGSFNSQ